MAYIQDLKVIIEKGLNFKLDTNDAAYFTVEINLLELLKWNALLRIGNSLQLFADPKYKDFSLWEKFNEKF